MFGKLLSTAIKVVTVPVDITNTVIDVAAGGDGSKRSRADGPLGFLEETRDAVARTVEEIDE